jgi:serine/threonine protein kinase
VKGFGMSCPDLKVEDVQKIITNANDIELLDSGGQKIVFTGVFDGIKYALKFMKPESNVTDLEERDFFDSVMARAKREVETMRQCVCPHLVKMGPMGLQTCTIGNSTILYYSEEYIEGSNLKQYFRSNGVFSVPPINRSSPEFPMIRSQPSPPISRSLPPLETHNEVTTSFVDHAIAKLSFFRGTGILQVRPDGMWEQ